MPAQQRHHAGKRHRGVGTGTDIAQQVRHQVIPAPGDHATNGTLVEFEAEIGDQRHHPMAIVVAQVRQHGRNVIFLQGILPQFTPVFRERIVLRFAFIIIISSLKIRRTLAICAQPFGQCGPVVHAMPVPDASLVPDFNRQGLGLFATMLCSRFSRRRRNR